VESAEIADYGTQITQKLKLRQAQICKKVELLEPQRRWTDEMLEAPGGLLVEPYASCRYMRDMH
jgi:hypothetical protein